ncbi:MAG TPA: hypothetical protein VFM30_04190 [Steroidobacteraceae bacterium]|nr:hypothetical protein [Steroidobacteraceae bacterium]
MPTTSPRAGLLASATLLAASTGFDAGATGALSIDAGALQGAGCLGLTTCVLDGATVTATGGTLAKKTDKGQSGFGVNGGASGEEIDLGQKVRVDYDRTRTIVAIKFVFLFNGPEYGDRAEKAQVTVDGQAYTLSVRNNADDATADWSGPGSVSKCGATTSSGSGCFVVTDPFPGGVSRLEFTAIPGGAPYAGAGNNESDYAIGFVDAGAEVVVDLANCASATGCPIAAAGGTVSSSLNSLDVTNPGGSTDATVLQVRIPDCRYIPQECVDLLPPANDGASSDDAARLILIKLGVIKPLATGADRLKPAAQLLNATKLLPAEVTSRYDSSGKPPNGLPPMYIGARWRGQAINGHWIDALFFVTEPGVVFRDTFEGLIDVSELTGHELGCFPNLSDLYAWDMITSVSERAKSVKGRYGDKLLNVGCINPTKVSGDRLSLYSVNLEIAPDTWGPTITGTTPKVTTANDAVFARLVQALWADLGETKARYACKPADPGAGGVAPIPAPLCETLAAKWRKAKAKINACVKSTFKPPSAAGTTACALAKTLVADFEATLPATPTGPDAYNRVGELKARVDVFQHVWDERFLNSLKPGGFCREKGSCAP